MRIHCWDHRSFYIEHAIVETGRLYSLLVVILPSGPSSGGEKALLRRYGATQAVQVLHIKISIFNICEPRTQGALQGSFIETPFGAAIG